MSANAAYCSGARRLQLIFVLFIKAILFAARSDNQAALAKIFALICDVTGVITQIIRVSIDMGLLKRFYIAHIIAIHSSS
jgi:hypothetical protein